MKALHFSAEYNYETEIATCYRGGFCVGIYNFGHDEFYEEEDLTDAEIKECIELAKEEKRGYDDLEPNEVHGVYGYGY